jgi:hypothetical protein
MLLIKDLLNIILDWFLKDWWIITPTLIKRILLKMACATRWYRTIISFPDLNSIMRNPSWDSVEKATTFLKSHSSRAAADPINSVRIPNIKLYLKLIKWAQLNLIMRAKPAVTSVLLCTSALTGVGALIAAGNQENSGN